MQGIGQREVTFRYDLLDQSNSYIGTIDVDMDQTPLLSNSINRTVKRQLSGLRLPPSTTAQIDTLRHRVRPMMVFHDGSVFPLGVFLFADTSRYEHLYSSVQFTNPNEVRQFYTTAMMLDQLMTLDQATNGVNFYPPGHSIYDALIQQLEAGGVDHYNVEPSSATIRGGSYVVWPVAENRLTVINDLLAMGGYYSLFFDNEGTAQCRLVPDLDSTVAEFQYGPRSENVMRDPIPFESDDLLDAPNRYIVVNTSFTDSPIWGAWDVPSTAPHSYANRGFYAVKKIDMQGVETNAEARKAAKAHGQADYSTYRWVTFNAVFNPLHDTYNIVEWDQGDKYREQSWSAYLDAQNQMMTHELRRIWADEDVFLPEEVF